MTVSQRNIQVTRLSANLGFEVSCQLVHDMCNSFAESPGIDYIRAKNFVQHRRKALVSPALAEHQIRAENPIKELRIPDEKANIRKA